MTYKSNNFKFGRNPYASHDEWEAAEDARQMEDQESLPDLEWETSKGSRVQVYRDSNGFMVVVDGEESFNNFVSPVPEKLAAAAAKHNIVAMLGPVGLTAEHKAALEGLRKWGQK